MGKSGIVWQGASLLDGKPLVVVAIHRTGRVNKKTGAMVQTYILRSDMDPREANQTGQDYSICGNCPHRGKALGDDPVSVTKTGPKGEYESVPLAAERTCYVNMGQGVIQVYKAFLRGNYPVLTDDEAVDLATDTMVRIGTYGDGAAVPKSVWYNLTRRAKGRTGYTHQSNVEGVDFDPDLFMVSVETLDQAKTAWSKGYRTFRVTEGVETSANEILCPASVEAGSRTTCIDCGLCAGTSSKSPKSITIPAHGTGKRHFPKLIATG